MFIFNDDVSKVSNKNNLVTIHFFRAANVPNNYRIEMDSKSYDEIVQYLIKGKYPNGYSKDDKRKMRLKCKRFHMHEGQMLTKQNRRVIQDEEKKGILKATHDNCGHFGVEKT